MHVSSDVLNSHFTYNSSQHVNICDVNHTENTDMQSTLLDDILTPNQSSNLP